MDAAEARARISDPTLGLTEREILEHMRIICIHDRDFDVVREIDRRLRDYT